jgi:hypothetical protein
VEKGEREKNDSRLIECVELFRIRMMADEREEERLLRHSRGIFPMMANSKHPVDSTYGMFVLGCLLPKGRKAAKAP